MNKILIIYEFLNKNNKLIFDRFLIIFTTAITLFTFGKLSFIKGQTISKNSTPIVFYGSEKEPTIMGGEYIIFQYNNNVAQGLVYVQNSDVFSCFQGIYDRQSESFGQLIFAYPEMGSDEWIKTESQEKMSLKNFPHQLNDFDINENTQQLFNQCLNYFEQN